jgi:flagellar basal body P-ring formation protein FlgA
MKRSIILFLLMVMAYGNGASANAAELRSSTMTDDSVIRIGDLFSFGGDLDAGKSAYTVIGPAPAPGKRKVLNSLQLAAIARRHGIDWKPGSRYERTVVSRSGTLISTEEIEDAVTQIMLDKGMGKDRKVRLSNSSRRIYAAANQDVSFTIENASFNRRTGRITASMLVPHGNGDSKQISLTGRVLNLMRVPVLSRRVKTGDVIRKADIDWIEVEARHMRDSFVTSAESLIDQQVVRTLTAGRPVRTRDVRSRVLISKGSLATLTLTTNRMLLTVRVLAMSDGGLGETIRVLNTRSKKTIEGIVTGPGRIVVPTLGLTQGS